MKKLAIFLLTFALLFAVGHDPPNVYASDNDEIGYYAQDQTDGISAEIQTEAIQTINQAGEIWTPEGGGFESAKPSNRFYAFYGDMQTVTSYQIKNSNRKLYKHALQLRLYLKLPIQKFT